MKRFLLLALALIAVGCAEPEPRNVEELVTRGTLEKGNTTYLDPETLEPYSGAVFEVYPEEPSKLMRRFNLKDGVEDGLYEMYYSNGQLWIRSMMKAGQDDGLFESYHQDGVVNTKGMVKDGQACGEWIEFEKPMTYPPC